MKIVDGFTDDEGYEMKASCTINKILVDGKAFLQFNVQTTNDSFSFEVDVEKLDKFILSEKLVDK